VALGIPVPLAAQRGGGSPASLRDRQLTINIADETQSERIGGVPIEESAYADERSLAHRLQSVDFRLT
jgi:hypothetical protein